MRQCKEDPLCAQLLRFALPPPSFCAHLMLQQGKYSNLVGCQSIRTTTSFVPALCCSRKRFTSCSSVGGGARLCSIVHIPVDKIGTVPHPLSDVRCPGDLSCQREVGSRREISSTVGETSIPSATRAIPRLEPPDPLPSRLRQLAGTKEPLRLPSF